MKKEGVRVINMEFGGQIIADPFLDEMGLSDVDLEYYGVKVEDFWFKVGVCNYSKFIPAFTCQSQMVKFLTI